LCPPVLAQGEASSTGTPQEAFLETLTPEERAWLDDHPVIRVAQDPAWAPVEFVDERGQPSGMSEDYLRLVEERLGITFQRVTGLTWQEAYAQMQRWEIDMTTSVAVTPQRSRFWAFTSPYQQVPIVIVAASNVTYIGDIAELSGARVAVVDGYAASDWLPRDYPDIELLRVASAEQGLQAVQRGEAFAYVENMLVVGYYLARLKLTTLKIAGDTPYANGQCMAVRKDWAPLAGILDKALASISEAERDEIYRKWLPVRYEHGPDALVLRRVVLIAAAILAGSAAWILRLKREIAARKSAQQAAAQSALHFQQLFDSSPMPVALIGIDGRFLGVSKRWADSYGYALEDAPTLQRWWELVCPDPNRRRDAINEWEAALQSARSHGTQIGPFSHRIVGRDGQARATEITATLLGNDVLTVFQDVTQRQTAEEEQIRLLKEAERSGQAMRSALEEQERTREQMLETIDQLRRFQEVTVGREHDMIALKSEVNGLLERLGQTPKYTVGL